jgi:antitoxin (DNA-binding transcriptional repressor) of toxin-antitoxin stability system
VSTTVTVHAAKTHLSRPIEQVLRGEEVVIARGDKPVVRLVPVDAPKPCRVPGTLKGRLEVPDSFFDPLPEDELKLWEGG